MTFIEFLAKVRNSIGGYCPDQYWKWKFSTLADKSEEGVKKEMPFLAVGAVGDDYASRMSGKRQKDGR
jgi:hypothetical protein